MGGSGRTKSKQTGRKEGKLIMGDTRENKAEPFEGKTQTELEDHPTEVQRTRGGDNPGSVVRGKPVVKNRKETHQEQERRNSWRTGIGRRGKLGYYQWTKIVRGTP